MAILRKRQIEVLAQLNDEELESYVAALPAEVEKISGLIDYLETKLERQPCDHSLRYSMQYIMENRLNFPKLTAWLNDNGGYCDCKVIEQIMPQWRKVFA